MTTTYTSAYLDVPGYLRAATNQETALLLGLNTRSAAQQRWRRARSACQSPHRPDGLPGRSGCWIAHGRRSRR